MSKVDVEAVTDNIRKKIESYKIENEKILDFIAYELSKSNTEIQEGTLENIVNYIDDKYSTKDEVKEILQNKIENFNTINFQFRDTQNTPNVGIDNTVVNSKIFRNMRQLFNKLENNKDLSNLQDTVLHFGSKHMSIAKRIFFLQVTQNYLSAIKYFVINDLVSKQTTFNYATEESFKNIVNTINDLMRENTIVINELKNYQRDSEKWIQSNEYKIGKLEEKFKDLKSKIQLVNDEFVDNTTNLKKQFVDSTANLENQIKSNARKYEEMQISLSYNALLKRDPAPWEYDFWITSIDSGVIHYNDLANKIRNQEESKQLMKNYLIKKGISFMDDNTAFRKIGEHTIYFDSNDHILIEILSQKDGYEKTTITEIKKLLKNGMNVINIGANVGYLTLICAKEVGKKGKVFAIEPYPKNVEFLQKNIVANGYTNVEVFPYAVSNKSGKTSLWLKPSGTWHFISTKKIEGLEKIEVTTITIDDLLNDRKMRPDLVVIDAEGSEKFILEGMKHTIQENPDLNIIMEFNPFALEAAGTNAESLLDLIKELGFSIYIMDENTHNIRPATKEETLWDYKSPKFTNLFLTKKPQAGFS